MARNRAKKDKTPAGPLQAMHDRAVNEKKLPPKVSEFAEQHGDYDRNGRFVVNRGGTAIDRWKTAGLLTEVQQAAILHCQRLWQLIDHGPRLVANLDRTVFGSPGEGNVAEIEARSDVLRIKRYFPDQYWNIYERVCRFDEPAGTAGSRLSTDAKAMAGYARMVVCFVADTIAMRERLSY